jgi:chemotaxis protein methyltransferase CheR
MDTSVSELDFAFIQRLMRERCGFVLEPDKHYVIEARLAPVASRYGLVSIAALVAQLRAEGESGALPRDTVEAVLNGETAFLRDVQCWNALKHVVLPALIKAREAQRTLRLWSAACSTGQEPYSLAMLLMQSFPELAGWDVSILATDVSKAHVQRAREGRYAQLEVNRGLPASYLVQYFEQEGRDWLLCPEAMRRVEFRELNLVQPWPHLPDMDLILLRNVMIYWDSATKREVLDRIARQLREGGVLVLGGAETTFYIADQFDRLDAQTPCCFRLKPADKP